MSAVPLTPSDHDRQSAGLTYVYPVVSRRAQGVSVGINLNPNNACNWRCVYCQVPGLTRGKGPRIDMALLAGELEGFLDLVLSPGWMERHAPEGARRLNDLALSGNGEPTSSPQFAEVVDLAAGLLERRGLAGEVKLVLITNGSLVHLEPVQAGLRRMAEVRGEVWFKLDGASDEVLRRVNDCRTGIERQLRNLATAARLAPTWVQTLVCDFEGPTLDAAGRAAYARELRRLIDEGAPLRGVLLYGLARPSHQPEAPRLDPLPRSWMESFADEIRAATGLAVDVHS
jgi:wyosine [tRNA(Phe)-imidazoG37] synthetase (radical SAM superfamily)